MRTEIECRREDFKEGVPVTFGNGLDFSVPKPDVRFVPKAGPDPEGPIDVGVVFVYRDRAVRPLVKAVEDAETGVERLRHLFGLASALLRLNYDLTADDLAELLSFDADDPSGGLMLLNCHAVAAGRDPIDVNGSAGDEKATLDSTEGVPETAEATP